MKRFALMCIILIACLDAVSGGETTIVISGNEAIAEMEELINDTVVNETEITQAQYSDLLLLVSQLKDQTELMIQEKEYLNALNHRLESDREMYIDVLDENEIHMKNQDSIITVLRKDYEDLKENSAAKMETMNTWIQASRLELKKYQMLVYFWVFIGVLLTVIIFEVFHSLNKRGKLYFVMRWIRNRIPIQF